MFVVSVLIACAPHTPTAAPAAVETHVRARGPCPLPATYGAWVDATLPMAVGDIEKAGLGAELAARPFTTLFPPEEFAQLEQARDEGRCERVVYDSDGLGVVAYIFHPVADGRRHPVVVYTRGGNREFGSIGAGALLTFQRLAAAGYLVIGSQYRGVEGGEGADAFGGADVDDVLNLVPVVRGLPDADVERMFLLGGSRGAMQGLMAVRQGLDVRAAAFRGGMFDLRVSLSERPELREGWTEMIPDFATDEAAQLSRRSAVDWADEIHVPILLLHGRQDWRVTLPAVERFDAALGATPHRLVVYEREEHQLSFHREAWLSEVLAWFERWA